jgi:2-polyprenyl-3-methyl-5-hydroxy-6-metoxy-1,4-benzoquinol methylase
MSKTTDCKICGNSSQNTIHFAQEMMFGYKDRFEYLECANCKSIQLNNIPENISKYYPENYYSYHGKSEKDLIQETWLKSLKRSFKKKLLNYNLEGKNPIGKLISQKFKGYYPWLKQNTINNRSKILDIGCGSGELLLRMYNDGFRDLTGLDPFIPTDIQYKCGITIHKKTLTEFKGQYDMIMLHHTFEHMDEPLSVLKNIANFLAPKGILLLRIPVANCYAWRKYGVNWVQLDPPRHFHLHTVQGMTILCNQSGYIIEDVVYDSYNLQFEGSERYLRDITLMDKRSIFTKEEIEKFDAESARLNSIHDGDAACFYLRKK